MQENSPDMQCLKALIQGVISHTTTYIPSASNGQSGEFLARINSVICASLSLYPFKTMEFLINTTKCALFYLIKSAHILTSEEFFTLILFSSPSLPKEPISSQALLLTIIENKQDRRKETELWSKSHGAVQYWKESKREKWGKTLLNRQQSRNSSPNRLQCVFNSSHSTWICIHLGKRCWIAQWSWLESSGSHRFINAACNTITVAQPKY